MCRYLNCVEKSCNQKLLMYETATAIGGFFFLRYLTVHIVNVHTCTYINIQKKKKDLLKKHKKSHIIP